MTFEALRSDMVAAMKARDKVKKDNLSFLIAAIKKEAIDKGFRDDIPEDLVDKVIIKVTKLAKEQVDTCPETRPELMAEYQTKYETFKSYAPAQLSEDDIEKYIRDNFADLIESKNKGMLMKNTIAALGSQADGKTINKIVAKICG
ncbi:MAG: GatB/YqeY domain-containing protein [Clostridia bacterium]|nr:GatB/YqeY domain-containing protein [Clostridia bacterium]